MQTIVTQFLDAFLKNPLVFVFIVAGAFLGTIVPYLRKKKIKKPEDLLIWDWNYIYKAFVSSLWVTIGSAGLFSAFSPPDGVGKLVVLIAAFVFGYGGKELQEEFIKNFKILYPIVQQLLLTNRQ